MPTYDYECETCGHRFEVFQSMKDRRLTRCPGDVCPAAKGKRGKGKVKRLLGTGAGVIFKGSGFYETDYRSDSYKQAAKNDAKASESSSADSKGDSASASSSKSEKKASDATSKKAPAKAAKSSK